MNGFYGGKEASELLKVHQRTLYLWDKKGLIEVKRSPGGKRFYNVKKYLDERTINKVNYIEDIVEDIIEEDEKKYEKKDLNIIYVRVSSVSQKNDLERQKKDLMNKYKDYLVIEDIGSGLNLNKRGIRKIIKLAIEGKVKRLVVAHRDRLTRFGYELIEDLIKSYSKGEIIVEYSKEKKSDEEEMIEDLMSILNVYVAKMNGLRKYKQNT